MINSTALHEGTKRQRDMVLDAIRCGPKSNSELNGLLGKGSRIGPVIQSLRERGYKIIKRPVKNTRTSERWIYSLVGYRRRYRINQWKDVYYGSDWWSSIRSRRLEKDMNECVHCKSTSSLQVHHWRYTHLFAEKLSDLTTLCEDCHGTLHGSNSLKVKFPIWHCERVYGRLAFLAQFRAPHIEDPNKAA